MRTKQETAPIMKISIWQQFSSNHSADFTVVGKFATPADAESGAERLREILSRLYDEFSRIAHIPQYDFRTYIPSQVEQDISKEFDVTWEFFHEWLIEYPFYHDLVVVFDEYVFFTRGDTRDIYSYQPFDEILSKLGATIRIQQGEVSPDVLVVDLEAVASDVSLATKLSNNINSYLEELAQYQRESPSYDMFLHRPLPPWIFHYIDKPDVDSELLIELRQQFWEHNMQWHELAQKLGDLTQRGIPEHNPLIKELRKQMDEHQGKLPIETRVLTYWLDAALNNTSPLTYGNTRVLIADNRITITNLWFGYHLNEGLPALVTWLRAERCKVTYTIKTGNSPNENFHLATIQQ